MKQRTTIEPALVTAHGVLYRSDCLELMATMSSESIDCIFADPPFNLGKEYNNGQSDLLKDRDYLDWCRLWISESVRMLKPGGAIFIYNLPRWAYQMAAYLEEQEMEFRHWIAVSMKGTFPRGNKLYPAHYALLYFTKGSPKTFNRVRLPIQVCRHCGKDIRLRRTSKISQSGRPEPHGLLGRYVSRKTPQKQVALAH
jgi:site-specific DNA-methyltransferase (adenine-specific)